MIVIAARHGSSVLGWFCGVRARNSIVELVEWEGNAGLIVVASEPCLATDHAVCERGRIHVAVSHAVMKFTIAYHMEAQGITSSDVDQHECLGGPQGPVKTTSSFRLGRALRVSLHNATAELTIRLAVLFLTLAALCQAAFLSVTAY